MISFFKKNLICLGKGCLKLTEIKKFLSQLILSVFVDFPFCWIFYFLD